MGAGQCGWRVAAWQVVGWVGSGVGSPFQLAEERYPAICRFTPGDTLCGEPISSIAAAVDGLGSVRCPNQVPLWLSGQLSR